MDVTPKTLREVEFREKMRGYHPEDVDQFLEQVANGLEVMQDRLRQAVDRAQRAEQAASDVGGSDETLRKTLVLAQRTADLAVQEAREQASRLLAGAEQKAQSLLADAEQRARRMHDEALGDVRAELAKLETNRAQTQQEVDILHRWVDDHRAHLTAALQDALVVIQGVGVLSDPPSSRPAEGSRQQPLERGATPAAATPAASAGERSGGEARAGGRPFPKEAPSDSATSEREAPYLPPVRPTVDAAVAGAAGSGEGSAAETQALDDFFDENDYDDDRRFGGRLRRRR